MTHSDHLPSEVVRPTVTFSPMRREDLAAVLAIERLSYPRPWSGEFFLQELGLPFSRILLAWVDVQGETHLAGYLCRWLTGGELHILNVAVHPDWRRQSIARRLVHEVIAEARSSNAHRGILEVRRTNLAALSLYESVGFTRVGVRRNYYGLGEDAWIMELPIDART